MQLKLLAIIALIALPEGLMPIAAASCITDYRGNDVDLLSKWEQKMLESAEALYPSVRDLALQIMKQKPPTQYFYIPVGGSMSALDAFFENILPSNVANLPASKNGLGLLKLRPSIPNEIPPDYENTLDEFFPTRAQLEGRRPLIIDILYRGQTFAWLNAVLPLYLKEREIAEELSTMAITDLERVDYVLPEYSRIIIQESDPIHDRLGGQIFKTFRKYSSNESGKTDSRENVLPAYTVYRDRMRAMMLSDEQISLDIRENMKKR